MMTDELIRWKDGHGHARRLLMEMNVANIDDLKQNFTAMLDDLVATRQATVAAPVRDLLIKRAVRAMQNDERGNMVDKTALTAIPDQAPPWLAAAIERNEPVFTVHFKDGFQDRLAHVIDWIAVDPNASRTIRAAPEVDYLGRLAKTADDYFTALQKSKTVVDTEDEAGREVIMTFRHDPTTQQVKEYNESALVRDPARGPIVAFWCRLTSKDALNREGELMGHCVGSYAAMVQEERVNIYSLRDQKNLPHATVELQRTTPPTINQVKGKSNAPPVGKYSPYVRDFLNYLGVRATGTGANDLRGMGLLTKNGKFGTIIDIGGTIVVTFTNGDSLRTIVEDEAEDPRRSYMHNRWLVQDYYYVERSGTVPLQVTIQSEKTEGGTLGTAHISRMTILRGEVSRYPVYATNLVGYLNASNIKSNDPEVLAKLDVFFNEKTGRWGSREEVMEVVLSKDGLDVSRLKDRVYFSQGKTLLAKAYLATARYGTGEKIIGIGSHRQSGIMVINDSPALRTLPNVFAAVANKYLESDADSYSAMPNESKQTLLDMGLSRRKDGYLPIRETRTIFRSPHGSVRALARRFFFYDPENQFLGSAQVGPLTDRSHVVSYNSLQVVGRANKLLIYPLLADMTTNTELTVKIDKSFDTQRDVREAGYVRKKQRLVPLSMTQYTAQLSGGFTLVSDKPEGYHADQLLMLQRSNATILTAKLNDDDVVSEIVFPANSMTRLADYRVPFAAMLNAARAKVFRRSMLKWFLKEKDGKILPQTDEHIVRLYSTGSLPIDKDFSFRLSANARRNALNFTVSIEGVYGSIYFKLPADETGEMNAIPVVSVNWINHGTDVTYQLHRQLPQGVARADAIKIAAKFMHFFDKSIDPFIVKNALVGGGNDSVGQVTKLEDE